MIHGGLLPCVRHVGCVRQVLTLRAAQFPDAFATEPSVTAAAYADDPLFKLGAFRKGQLLQRATWKTLVKLNPSFQLSKVKADPGLRVDGRRRAQHQAEFDFMCGTRRVECKSASMQWMPSWRYWRVSWTAIKFNQAYFDDLVLALHSPGQVDIVLHDGTAGVSTMGTKTPILGHAVQFRAGRGFEDPAVARRNILGKMLQPVHLCQHLATLTCESLSQLVADELGRDSPALCWYVGVPLADLSSCARGLRLEAVAFAVDQMLHPCSNFRRDAGSTEVVGTVHLQRRGSTRTSADWLRDDIKVEFKSSRLSWTSTRRTWRCHFRGIKFAYSSSECPAMPAPFDELWLGVYSPRGLHIVQYGGSVGHSKAGAITDLEGYSVQVSGPSGQDCPDACLDVILRKLEQSGCTLLATVAW
ncbi:mad2l1-1 [Symbiodinium sp. CCMP2592]|nr:mad2l1-1 [Symbiodinium sp. CCMP2592]